MENFLLVIVLLPIVLVTAFILIPVIKGTLKIRQLRKIGAEKAGLRGIDEILAEINEHNDALHVCKEELTKLLQLQSGIKTPEPVEPPKSVKIVFNSKEVGCQYRGIELPKYVMQDDKIWYEFESLAVFDADGKAVVDDAESNYITISDAPTQSSFFYRQLASPPVLNTEIEENKLETV